MSSHFPGIIHQMVERLVDSSIGTMSLLAGSGGLLMQIGTNVLNTTVLVINLALAVGGLLLLRIRYRIAREEERKLRMRDEENPG